METASMMLTNEHCSVGLAEWIGEVTVE